MKTLQNNFTTPEQSKRLLELGVPADSADCIAHIVDNSIDLYEDFFLKGDVRISVINERHTYTKATTLNDGDRWLDEPYPCWSLGRLIEIFLTCTGAVSTWCSFLNGSSTIEYILEYRILPALKDGHIDFSKLEE